MRNRILILSFVLLAFVESQSQEIQHKWLSEDGVMPERAIKKMVIDETGFIWMTGNELYKFNGRDYISFAHLYDGAIQDIQVSSKNEIWVRIENGLLVVDPLTDQKIWEASSDSLFVDHIIPHKDEMLLLIKKSNDSYLLRSKSQMSFDTLFKFDDATHGFPVRLTDNADSLYYVGKNSEIILAALSSGSEEILDSITYSRFEAPHILELIKDSDNKLWVVQNVGAEVKPKYWDEKKKKLVSLDHPSDRLNYIGQQTKDRWWFYNSTIHSIILIDMITQKVIYKSPSEFESRYSFVLSIDNNTSWASSDYGVLEIRQTKYKNFNTHLTKRDESKDKKSFRALAELPSGEWFVTSNNGSYLMDPGYGRFERIPVLENGIKDQLYQKHKISIDKPNSCLWMSDQHNSISLLPLNNGSLESLSDVTRLSGASKGVQPLDSKTLIASSGNLLKKFDIQENKFRLIAKLKKGIEIRDILLNRNGGFWLTTDNGIYRMDKEGKTLSHFHEASDLMKLSSNDVSDLVIDSFDNMWVATMSGLTFLDFEANTSKHFYHADGLSDNRVCAILIDHDNNVWASTFNGLNKYDIGQNHFVNFFKEDGLPHNEFNRYSKLHTSDGRFLFGGVNGFISFFPSEITYDLNSTANLVMTSITTFEKGGTELNVIDKGLAMVDKLEISPYNKYFRFDFALLDYYNSEQSKYAWFLEGYDKDWQTESYYPFVQYNNIAAGKYTFRVKAADANGMWSKSELSIDVTIDQFFYMTWWFYASMVGLISGLTYLFYRSRLEKALAVERLRTRIASDLHDEIGSRMTKISLNSDMIKAGVYNAQERIEALDKIAEESQSVVSTMNDVVWSIDSRNDDFDHLIDRMKEHCQEMFLDTNIQYDLKVDHKEWKDVNHKISLDFRQNVYFIFKEAINNIVKHSNADKVNVSIERKRQHLIMHIRDNGKKASKYGKTGQGISNMKMRTNRLDGTFTLDRTEGFHIFIEAPLG